MTITHVLIFSPYKGAWVLKTTDFEGNEIEDVLSKQEAIDLKDSGIPNETSEKHMNMIPALLDIFA